MKYTFPVILVLLSPQSFAAPNCRELAETHAKLTAQIAAKNSEILPLRKELWVPSGTEASERVFSEAQVEQMREHNTPIVYKIRKAQAQIELNVSMQESLQVDMARGNCRELFAVVAQAHNEPLALCEAKKFSFPEDRAVANEKR